MVSICTDLFRTFVLMKAMFRGFPSLFTSLLMTLWHHTYTKSLSWAGRSKRFLGRQIWPLRRHSSYSPKLAVQSSTGRRVSWARARGFMKSPNPAAETTRQMKIKEAEIFT